MVHGPWGDQAEPMREGRVSGLRVERHGPVTLCVLDRPERRNALDHGLRESLRAAAAELDADDEQRVGVLAGAGPVFCAGADLRELSERAQGEGLKPVRSTTMMVGESAKPWVAALDGPAVAGGLELALNCDLRIAAASAWFALTEVSLGMIPGVAVHQLVRQLAWGDAMWLLISGERIDAAAAERMGLVQRVVPADALGDAMALAERIAGFSPAAVRACKAIARRWRDRDLDIALAHYRDLAAPDDRREDVVRRIGGFFDRSRGEGAGS